jgi:hypothetical protein
MTSGPHLPKNDFVTAPDPRTGRRKLFREEIWLKVRVPLLLAVFFVLGVTCVLLYTADRRQTRQSAILVTPEQAEALRLKSLQLEAAFEKIRQDRFDLREEDIALLEGALRAQEEHISARQSIGTDNARQQSLRRRLHLIRGERLRHDSDEAEAKALIVVKADEPAAIQLLRRAIECELEIEQKWEFSGLAEPGRRARLDTRLRRLESGPLWQRGRELEAAAEKLFTAGKFTEAAASFNQAMECETEFLARYRDVRNTEFGRFDKLAERRETAISGEVWNGVKAQRAKAEGFEQAGDWPAATRAWQAAVDAFAKLLTDFPRSAFADRTLEALISTRFNHARFHGEIVALRARRDGMRAALRARRAEEAIRLADELVLAARRLADANTGAFLPEDNERRELEYLAGNAAVVRGLLEGVDRNLLPIPGMKARLYRTEIPQGVFASVMGSNPSSVRREANPVESVTYAEATTFATRVGWLLGAPARLPTVAEFTAAAGDLDKPVEPRQAWGAENTDGASARAVATTASNPFGFHDLLGNVEEWTMAAPDDLRAPAVGGSVATLLGKGLPSRSAFKREKSRTLGFRIVIE